jgi:hypothetical protein
MSFATDIYSLNHAPVDQFALIRPRILSGQRLSEIITLQESILRYGLLNPLRVMKKDNKLIIIDGRKRFLAIKRLAFAGRVPRSLKTMPYRLMGDETLPQSSILIRNEALYEAVSSRHKRGERIEALARDLSISHQCVRDILSLNSLAAPLRTKFYARLITYKQMRAYAACPDKPRQISAYATLGPFAAPSDILDLLSHAPTVQTEKVYASKGSLLAA